MTSYESVLKLISSLRPSKSGDERDLKWIDVGHVVAVSRTADGAIEIFLAGEALKTSTPAVRKQLRHEKWHRKGHEPLVASRLVLPMAGHFDQVAAFICTELLRNEAGTNLQSAFAATEALIALAIESLMESDSWLRGLLGEVLLLEAMLRNASDDKVASVLSGWSGHQKSLRDFTYGSAGIEVKTTTRKASSHKVEGVHQLELQHGGDEDGDKPEESLLLVSIGIKWAVPGGDDYESALNLPSLVDAVVLRCQEALGEEAQTYIGEFLDNTENYGASPRGYNHASMANEPFYAKLFQHEFVRGYDLLDERIKILNSDDVANRPNTVDGSVTFRINLPETVNGDINPVEGLNKVAKQIVDQI